MLWWNKEFYLTLSLSTAEVHHKVSMFMIMPTNYH